MRARSLQGLATLVGMKGVDWSKWHVFWADERVVKLTDPDSNYKLAKVRSNPLFLTGPLSQYFGVLDLEPGTVTDIENLQTTYSICISPF